MPLGNALQALIMLAVVLIGSVFFGNLFRRIAARGVGVIFFGILMGTILALTPIPYSPCRFGDLESSMPWGKRACCYEFLVGIELRTYSKSTSTERSPLWQLVPCVAAPIVVCAAAAWPFAHQLVGPQGNSLHAWLFVGVALSVTAVPVLVLLMQDLEIPAPSQGSGYELP